MKLEAYVGVACYSEPDDRKDGDIARDPGKGQSIPERPNGKRAERALGHVGMLWVDESQSSHKDGKGEGSDVDVSPAGVKPIRTD